MTPYAAGTWLQASMVLRTTTPAGHTTLLCSSSGAGQPVAQHTQLTSCYGAL